MVASNSKSTKFGIYTGPDEHSAQPCTEVPSLTVGYFQLLEPFSIKVFVFVMPWYGISTCSYAVNRVAAVNSKLEMLLGLALVITLWMRLQYLVQYADTTFRSKC